jgi:acyl-ACP thioesterase
MKMSPKGDRARRENLASEILSSEKIRRGHDMYQFESRIRYSEVDENADLTWSALLNYFQDCSVFHSEAIHMSVSFLKEHHLAWVLSAWQVKLNQMPHLGERVKIQTWAYEMKAFYGYRNFRMVGEDDSVLAYADSVWVLVDTQKGRPVKVLPEMSEGYGLEPPLPMEQAGRKLEIPKELKNQPPIAVPEQFIDSNHHMNNEKYVMIAHEFLPKDFQIGELRVEYKKEAKLGDVIYPSVHGEENRTTVLLADESGRPYAVVDFHK